MLFPLAWRRGVSGMRTSVLLAVVMLFITALGLPMLYRFGSEKGRLAMILCMP